MGFGVSLVSILAASADEPYETYCAKVDAVLAEMPDFSALLVRAYPPAMYGKANTTVSILFKGDNYYATLTNLASTNYDQDGWRMGKARYPYSTSDPVWLPFERVNPPLIPGVEYRTTQRYNGKPVYVKLVDFGALPNNSAKLVEYAGGDTTTRTIEAHGVMTGGYVIPGSTGPDSYPNQVLEICSSDTEVGVITHTDRSSLTAQIVVKYWRTTD